MDGFPEIGELLLTMFKLNLLFIAIQVTNAFGQNVPLRWQVADSSRIFQDEYLEWSVLRDSAKNILSVTYTCEAPEVSVDARLQGTPTHSY